MANESPIQGWFQQGLNYHQAGELAKAEALYRKILAENPKHSDTLHLLGVLQQQNKNSVLAVQLIKQAIAINPNIAAYHSNLGIALRNLNCHQQALASYDRALALQFDFPDAHYNKGVVLEMLERYEQALQSYCYASQYKPDYTDALWNECLCHLKLGNLSTGFAQYERRWQNPKLDLHFFPHLNQPRWNGQDSLAGKTIFLVAEQGLGDTLQFCRYAERLAQLGAKVLLGVQPPLKTLLSQLAAVSGVYVKGDALPEFDYQCPLMSLPWLLKTELTSIPASHSYLSADDEQSAYWYQRLPASTRPKIGLVWSGGQLHKNDHNRSIALTEFAQLLTLSGHVEFISVQKDIRPNDQETLAQFNIAHYGPELTDFNVTAGLITAMDLVISVDTSIAHLAAALGKPVWLLLPFNADWRWLLHRDDSPWYPTMRLFRQATGETWHDVINRIHLELSKRFTDSKSLNDRELLLLQRFNALTEQQQLALLTLLGN